MIKPVYDIHGAMFKYFGCWCSVNGFQPQLLNTCYIDNVQAGAKVKLFLRPLEELHKDVETLQLLLNNLKSDTTRDSLTMAISYARNSDLLRARWYDLDQLFEHGYALHLDTLKIF